MPQQQRDWFDQFTAPPAKPKATGGEDWFSKYAAPDASKDDKSESFLSELGRGLKETAVGAAHFGKLLVTANLGTPFAPRASHQARKELAQGIYDTLRSDVEKLKAEPSTVAKIGRAAAMPLDALGLPVTAVSEDLAQGNVGHAIGIGGGALALVKAPGAAQALRGRLVAKPAPPVLKGRVVSPEQLVAPDPVTVADVPAAARVGEPVPARRAAVPELGPDAWTVAERRSTPRVPGEATTAADVSYARMREKVAAGESTGTPELRELGEQLSKTESFRDDVAKGRTPDAETTVLSKSEAGAEAPTFAGIQNPGNGILYLQFDRTGAPVTVEGVRSMFPKRNIQVSEFPENILSPHIRKFRIDVFDDAGRMSSKVASEMEREVGGGFHDWQRAGERWADTLPPKAETRPASALEAVTPESADSTASGAGKPPALSTEDGLYQAARDDARANGYTGTDAQLRYEFNRRLEQARSLVDEDAGNVAEFGPRALLEAIAKGGGLARNDLTAPLWENSTGFVRGQGTTKSGQLKASRTLPQGGLGGVSGVLKHDGLQLDPMVEYLRQDPRFTDLIGDVRDLLVALEDAAHAAPQVSGTSLESALQAAGVRRGERWWDEQGSAARSADAAPATGDWFDQFAARAGDDDFSFGANASDGGMVPPGAVEASMPQGPGKPIPPQRPLSATAKADEHFLRQLPEDVQGTLRAVWEKYDGFEDARRGVQPLERTQALADDINARPFNPSEGRGGGLAERVAADYDRLIADEREYHALGEKVKSGTASDSEWLRHRELDAERVLVAERARANTAEAGRAMRTIREKVNEYKALKSIIESHDPALQKEMRAAMQSGAFRQYVVANLTSGLATHERNALGGLSVNLLDTIATGVARPTEGAAMAYGLLHGMPRGLKEFAHVMRHGGSAFVVETKTPFYREMPGGMANPFNDVTRLLSATDRLNRAMRKQAEIDLRAFREASKLKTSEPFADRVARLRAEHPEWAIEADAIAANAMLQDTLGPFGRAVIDLRDSPKGLWSGPLFLVAPFARISMKIAAMNAAFSPAPYVLRGAQKVLGSERFPSALADSLRAPGRAGELARARARFGSAVLGALSVYVAMDQVTGDGPRDPGRRSLWLQNHQPNSIRMPDGSWVSYSGWSAFAIPLAVMANAKETIGDLRASGRNVDGSQAEEIGWNVLARTLNSITSASFLSGLQDFQQALDNPKASAQRWGARLTTALQPLSGLQRTVAQFMDPTVRKADGVKEAWQANTPGLSKSLPPMLDPFGEPVQRSQSPATVGILRVMKPKPDAVRDELQRLNVPLSRPTGDLTIPDRLPPDIQDAMRRLHSGSVSEHAQAQGRSKRQILERLILENPDWWRKLGTEQQLELIARAKSTGTRRANEPRLGKLYQDALLQQLSQGGR